MDVIIKPTVRKTGKKAKKPDTRPARKRYWASRTLEKHKIKNLMKGGMSKQQAYNHWHRVRKTRVPLGYLDKYVA